MSCGSKYEDRKQKRKENAGLMEAWSYAQYAGERERERDRERETQKTLLQTLTQKMSLYKCVCSMHTFYTSPYKD